MCATHWRRAVLTLVNAARHRLPRHFQLIAAAGESSTRRRVRFMRGISSCRRVRNRQAGRRQNQQTHARFAMTAADQRVTAALDNDGWHIYQYRHAAAVTRYKNALLPRCVSSPALLMPRCTCAIAAR